MPIPSKKRLIQTLLAIGVALLIAVCGWYVYRYFGPHTYVVNASEVLLPTPSASLKGALTFDTSKQLFTFTAGVANSDTSRQTNATPVTATLAIDASKGITVTDPTYKVDLGMTPQFALADGKQTDNVRLVYPFRDHSGWVVFTAQGLSLIHI